MTKYLSILIFVFASNNFYAQQSVEFGITKLFPVSQYSVSKQIGNAPPSVSMISNIRVIDYSLLYRDSFKKWSFAFGLTYQKLSYNYFSNGHKDHPFTGYLENSRRLSNNFSRAGVIMEPLSFSIKSLLHFKAGLLTTWNLGEAPEGYTQERVCVQEDQDNWDCYTIMSDIDKNSKYNSLFCCLLILILEPILIF